MKDEILNKNDKEIQKREQIVKKGIVTLCAAYKMGKIDHQQLMRGLEEIEESLPEEYREKLFREVADELGLDI